MKNINVFYKGSMPPTIQYMRYYMFAHYLNNENSKVGFYAKPLDWTKKSDLYEYALLSENDLEHLFASELNNAIENFDVFYTQRLIGQTGLAILDTFKHYNKKIVIEVDDNLEIAPYQPSFSNYYPGSELQKLFYEQLGMVDAVIVTQEYLRKAYLQYNKNIHVVKNCIQTKDFQEPLRNKDNVFRILWTGSSSHDNDLNMILPALKKIKSEYKKKVEIYILGGVPLNYKDYEEFITDKISLPYFDYIKKIASYGCDLGLAPLVENEFNNSKSNLRFLEYSGWRIPTIASNVFPFKEDIKKGFCTPSENVRYNNIQDWYSNIKYYIDMGKEYCWNEGERNFEYIKNEYNPENESKKLENVFLSF